MDLITCIFVIIGAILSLILFFKIWGMCNDVRALREKLAPKQQSEEQFQSDKDIEDWLNEDPQNSKKGKKRNK